MSDFHRVQENNESINAVRNHCRNVTTYLAQVAKATGDRFPEALSGIETLNSLSEILCDGYLSSGYAYDDDDPRNRLDRGGDDGYFDREAARNGSTPADEVRSEITRQVTERRIATEIADLEKVFTDDVAASIWTEKNFPFEGHEGVRGLHGFLADLLDVALEEDSMDHDALDGPSTRCLPSPQIRHGIAR